MKRTGRKKEWSVALFCFGLIAFFPPILSLFDHPYLLWGFPLTYLYLFGIWGGIILAVALSAKKRQPRNPVADYGSSEQVGTQTGEQG